MFSCILAKALTRDKRKAIIINAEISVPMLPVWLPEQIIQTNASVGQVLSSVEIDTSLVAGHVTVLKSYPFIGVMGYAAGENPLSYPEVKYAMVLQLVNAAARLVDFVILDCSSNMTNVFTPAAIESGDLVIRILTPDLKGVNYLKAHQTPVGRRMLPLRSAYDLCRVWPAPSMRWMRWAISSAAGTVFCLMARRLTVAPPKEGCSRPSNTATPNTQLHSTRFWMRWNRWNWLTMPQRMM